MKPLQLSNIGSDNKRCGDGKAFRTAINIKERIKGEPIEASNHEKKRRNVLLFYLSTPSVSHLTEFLPCHEPYRLGNESDIRTTYHVIY